MTRARIVVIDDHEASRELVRDTLEFVGYEVHTAGEVEVGLALCRELGCALVVLDLCLPGTDGLQAIAELRRDPALRAMRALAVTAQAFPEDRARALAAGFDAYLAKPVHIKELREVVVRLLADEGR